MPTRPRPPCPTLGCPNRTPCPDHQRTADRPSWRQRASQGPHPNTTGPGKVWRQAVLGRAGGRCQWCGMTATIADHVVPLARGGRPFDLANGQALCLRCHRRKIAFDARGR